MCVNSVYQALFPPPPHKSLGTRLRQHMHAHTVHFHTEKAYQSEQERMMTSFFIGEGGGRACNLQKFETGRISRVY